MENIKCKTCGGSVNRVGNYYVCEWCRNKWEIDSGNDIHAVERANAWAALRDGDFEKASELFENIILKDSKNHEAYWGRALALGGIIYVTDLSENKKVPTCNNITEDSFIKSKDVQKAISLAPSDIADSYKKQAVYIEKVRLEWLEKASKEPAYDVFISFKDSDRENGIERTQDSIDAQDLYNALVAEGYKVFFSRISLRDKIAEQYEPYIYNAIKTAKVMIVFGEKAEYFSSVWIKNEWSRFKTRIEKGEKHKNSLVVVYKNMNPGDLPVVLKSRQCLNASDMTFLSGLSKHIKRVISESPQVSNLERIEIKGGQVAKKATKVSHETIQIREIGAGAAAETSISEKQQFDLVKSYIYANQWEDAEKLVEDILFNNPTYADVIWYQLLIKHRAKDNDSLMRRINILTHEDLDLIEKVLNCTTKKKATELLDYLYDSKTYANEDMFIKILNRILPYDYENRETNIHSCIEFSISNERFDAFNVLLLAATNDDVDKYIEYNLAYADTTSNLDYKRQCIEAVIAVDSGNIEALNSIFHMRWYDSSAQVLISTLEEILKYSSKPQKALEEILDYTTVRIENANHCMFVKQAIKYHSGELSVLKDRLKALGNKMLSIDYENLLQNHKDILAKVKKIRNKLEHEIDNARVKSSCSSPSSVFHVTYKIDEKSFTIHSEELIQMVKDLNALFSKIQKDVRIFASQNNKQTDKYLWRLTRYDFINFNKIYESDLLPVFGQSMLPF